MDRLFGRILREPILKGFFKIRRGEAPIIDSPSMRVYFRVEGMSGTDRNMVGLRAKCIWGDEMAFSNGVCHNSRLQTALPNCKWLYAGVPNGVRNTPFWRLDQTSDGSEWSRHKYPTFINPLYESQEAKDDLEKSYGGKTTQGYITQVLGEWGEELLSSFPPGSIGIKNIPYYIKSLSNIARVGDLDNLPLMLGIPSVRVYEFCIGVDYGFSPDPEEIICAYRMSESSDEWVTYCRIELRRVAMPRQVEIILYIIRSIIIGKFAGLSCDNISLVQSLQSADPDNQDLYLWSSPAGITKTSIKESGGDKEVSVRNKEYYVTLLKRYLMNAVVGLFGIRLWLCQDPAAIDELVGTTERKLDSGYTVYYGPTDPRASGTPRQLDHIRDGLSYLCAAISLSVMSVAMDDTSDELMDALGWVGGNGWTPLTRD
jgi:hypothetical protein